MLLFLKPKLTTVEHLGGKSVQAGEGVVTCEAVVPVELPLLMSLMQIRCLENFFGSAALVIVYIY